MAFTREQAVEAGRKGAATRAANKAARLTAAQTENLAAAPPNPPPNYGIGREARGLPGGAIDPATRDLGVDLGARLTEANDPRVRPLGNDIVGDIAPPRAPAKVARSEAELPFKTKPGTSPAKSNGHKKPEKSAPSPIVSTADEQPASAGTTLTLPDWETCDLQEAQDALDATYAMLEAAAKLIQRRVTQSETDKGYRCEQCGKPVPDLRMAKMIQSQRDPESGIFRNAVWCSHRCFTGYIASGQATQAQET